MTQERNVVYIARHGETDANLAMRYAGRAADSLNDNGRQQAQRLGGQLSALGIGGVWTSDVKRAIETSEIIAQTLHVPIEIKKELTELGLGPWEGLTESEVSAIYPEDFRVWQERPDRLRIPGRETLAALKARIQGVIRDAAGQDCKVTLITHVAPIRTAVLATLGLPLRQYRMVRVDNCDCFEIRGRNVTRLGSASSMRNELSYKR